MLLICSKISICAILMNTDLLDSKGSFLLILVFPLPGVDCGMNE